jgi:hypothetical protein
MPLQWKPGDVHSKNCRVATQPGCELRRAQRSGAGNWLGTRSRIQRVDRMDPHRLSSYRRAKCRFQVAARAGELAQLFFCLAPGRPIERRIGRIIPCPVGHGWIVDRDCGVGRPSCCAFMLSVTAISDFYFQAQVFRRKAGLRASSRSRLCRAAKHPSRGKFHRSRPRRASIFRNTALGSAFATRIRKLHTAAYEGVYQLTDADRRRNPVSF